MDESNSGYVGLLSGRQDLDVERAKKVLAATNQPKRPSKDAKKKRLRQLARAQKKRNRRRNK